MFIEFNAYLVFKVIKINVKVKMLQWRRRSNRNFWNYFSLILLNCREDSLEKVILVVFYYTKCYSISNSGHFVWFLYHYKAEILMLYSINYNKL